MNPGLFNGGILIFDLEEEICIFDGFEVTFDCVAAFFLELKY